VRQGIPRLQELLLGSEDGFREFLSLLDDEKDAAFLEALMHHLPLVKTDFQDRILEDRELQEQIWEKFEGESAPERRLAFLRFFAFQRRLSAARMDELVELATEEKVSGVRQLTIDAIASNRDLIPDTWQVLAHVLQHDSAPECRETAIAG